MAGKVNGSWRQAKSMLPSRVTLVSTHQSAALRRHGSMATRWSWHPSLAATRGKPSKIRQGDELFNVDGGAGDENSASVVRGSKRDWTPIDDAKLKEAQNL